MKKCLALLLALLMVFSLAACGNPAAENTDQQPNSPAPNSPAPESPTGTDEYVPESGEHYTVTKTADGWYKIENDGGDTLGLSSTSGVHLLDVDGYAFKDLNQNGELDPYEDWRLSTEERATDLANQMQGAEIARLLSHGGWGNFTTEPLAEDDISYTFLHNGGRGGVTRNIARGGGAHAIWTNQIQAVAESCFYGIPAMISIDPANISGLVESVALASTMDPELAAEIGKTTAQQYRAAGVTALLGPQVDIASPVMSRAAGTYGEDPQLTLDITTAYVNAMQSTYGADGSDLGWGPESVLCFTKHYGGAGSTEGGRDDHWNPGRYSIFPGNNLEAHLITYFDGVFNLPGKTGASGIMTEYAVNVDGNGEPFGGEWAGAYNPYLYGLLEYAGYDGLIITDWGVHGDFGTGDQTGTWGTDGMTPGQRMALNWERGGMLLGGNSNFEAMDEGYKDLVNRLGQDEADAIMRNAACHFIATMINLEMFEQPYNDSAYADQIVYSDSANAFGLETQEASVVMLKNDGTISADGAAVAKPTVYVPWVYSTNFKIAWMTGVSEGALEWTPGMDLDVLGQYFNVVTDTLGEPSGTAIVKGQMQLVNGEYIVPEEEVPAYTPDDIIRASADDIAGCDYILVGMTAAYTASYNDHALPVFGGEAPETEDFWYPVSLQYAQYTAVNAPAVSVSGLPLADGTRENRTVKGNSTKYDDTNMGHLETLQYVNDLGLDIPVIVSMNMARGMVWSEVEPLADVILVCYQSQKAAAVAEIILGNYEPNGLLVFQQPKNMDAVEAQVSDVPRDMQCYVDSAGNTYDFAFGLNWSGVINDSRVQTYSAAPISKIQSIDYSAYAAANK